MISVRLDGVSLGYRGRAVLSGIDLALMQGEFVGLFGGNGAGKTTLLRALLGLIRPVAGIVEVLGKPAAPGRHGVGYLPQAHDGDVPAVLARDVLAASLRGAQWGWPATSKGDHAVVAAALESVQAHGLAERRLSELSGGERQRILIAQALMGSPRLLLLDEPLAGLDPRHQREMAQLIRRLQQSNGLTVLCSAHDINMLLPFMDRILYLGNGKAALGSPEEVVTGPVLSRLYNAPIEVVRLGGKVFVGADDSAPIEAAA